MKAEILSDLWQVGGAEFSAPEDAAVYLTCFGESAALIDAGSGKGHSRVVSNIYRVLPENARIKYLLLTHCHFDHTGGADALRQEYGCKIACHALDAVYLERGDSEVTAASWYGTPMEPLMIDMKIQDDPYTISVGNGRITAHHWPGHSPGSVVYTTHLQGEKVLFGQDVHGPLDPSFLSDPEAYQSSLRKLLDLDADLLCEGHFGVFRGKKAVQEFIRSFLSE